MSKDPLSNIKCGNCDTADNVVVDSRGSADGTYIYRRRECVNCNLRFTTREVVMGKDDDVFVMSKREAQFIRDMFSMLMKVASQLLKSDNPPAVLNESEKDDA